MNILTDKEVLVLAVAEAETGLQGLRPSDSISNAFKDSLEYVSFIIQLREHGILSEEVVTKAETIGDLADGLVFPN